MVGFRRRLMGASTHEAWHDSLTEIAGHLDAGLDADRTRLFLRVGLTVRVSVTTVLPMPTLTFTVTDQEARLIRFSSEKGACYRVGVPSATGEPHARARKQTGEGTLPSHRRDDLRFA